MNNAKNSGGKRTPRHGRRLGFGRQVLLLAALAVIAMGVVGGTVAYLVTKTGPVVNTFTPGVVSCKIDETFDGTTKSNVYVTNTGNTNAYIRAAIIVTWKDAAGNIAATVPAKGTDYTLELNETDWVEHDGYYYYKGSVAPNAQTENLIETCTAKNPYGDYTLSVEILADAIQSTPSNAVESSWHVSISNGSVTPKN